MVNARDINELKLKAQILPSVIKEKAKEISRSREAHRFRNLLNNLPSTIVEVMKEITAFGNSLEWIQINARKKNK